MKPRKSSRLHSDEIKIVRQLGRNLRARREAEGLSLTTLTKLTGLAKSAVWNAENGHNLTLRVLYKICWSLGIHPADVLPPFLRK